MPELLTRSFTPDRRGFLKTLGGGMLVLLMLDRDSLAQESGRTQHRPSHEDLPQNIAAWLHIAPNGIITAFTGKVEVGQNIRTSLTQAVADEFRCRCNRPHVMADTALTPWTWARSEPHNAHDGAAASQNGAIRSRNSDQAAAQKGMWIAPQTLRWRTHAHGIDPGSGRSASLRRTCGAES